MKSRSSLGVLATTTSLLAMTFIGAAFICAPSFAQGKKPAAKKQTQQAPVATPHPASVQIVYAVKDLPAGKMLTPQDVQGQVVEWAKAPGDAASSMFSVIGKKIVKPIGQAQIISVLDIGQPMTKEMKEKCLIRDYSSYQEPKSQIVYARVAIPAGKKFSAANLAMGPIPQRLVPQDSISHPGLVDRRTCKFGVMKFQIVTQHDIEHGN